MHLADDFARRQGPAGLAWSDTADETAETFATVPDFVEETIEATGILKDYVVRVAGRNVEITYSQGPGDPLVLLHGGADSAYSFRSLMPGLEAAGYRPIAVNLPGYRGSEALSGDFPTMRQVAEHLRAFFDEIAIARADIVGHGVGALAASALAHHFPERVARMVLSSVPAGTGVKAGTEEQAKAILSAIKEGADVLPKNCSFMAQAAFDMLRVAAPQTTPAGLRFAVALCCGADLQTVVPTILIPSEGQVARIEKESRGVDQSGTPEDSSHFVAAILAGFGSLPETAAG